MEETLLDTARREADEAEAEAEQPRRRGRPRKTEETNGANGHAKNGIGFGAATMHPPAEPPAGEEPPEEPAPGEETPPPAAAPPPTSEPGAQGSATQDDEDDAAEEEEKPFSRPSSAEQVRLASSLLFELKRNVSQLSMGEVVDRLLQIVDVAPAVTVPTSWAHGEERYAKSDVLETIGNLLLLGCPTLELAPSDVAWRWRNAKNWLKQGQVVIAEAKIIPTWARDLTGVSVIVHVNFREFIKLNSDQKVKRLYHTLRGLDAEAKRIPPQFHGWTDELEFFGPLTFEEEVSLVNAITRGRRKRFTYQLDLMDEAETAGAAAE